MRLLPQSAQRRSPPPVDARAPVPRAVAVVLAEEGAYGWIRRHDGCTLAGEHELLCARKPYHTSHSPR